MSTVKNVKINNTTSKLGGAGIYDITEQNNGATYATLSAALAAIPDNDRQPGMSVKYVQTSDNNSSQKYVQYRFTLSTFTAAQFANVANWQGVDDVPTAGSDNLVKSGGVYNVLPKKTKSISPTNNFVAGAMVVSNNTVVYDSSSTWNTYIVIGKTTLVHLKAGDVLNVNNGNAIYINATVSVVTKVTDFGTANESYECLVKGTGTTSKYVYVATEDMDVFISGPAGIKWANSIISVDKIVGNLSFIKDCILSEAFTVSDCVRDSDGNITSANIVYPDGKTGTLTVTRDSDGNATSAVYTYETESYTLSITRDSDWNVTSTSIN